MLRFDIDDILAAAERVYRWKESVWIGVNEVVFGILSAPSQRGLTNVVSRDIIRNMVRARTILHKDDIVITSRGKPAAVLVTVEEYERLTGRRINDV